MDDAKVTLVNCLLARNVAAAYGGGYLSNDFARELQTFINCTLAENMCDDEWGGGGLHGLTSPITANSCVLYLNRRGDLVDQRAQLWAGSSIETVFNYSCIQGLGAPGQAVINGTGNISSDPQFVNASAENYRLQCGSPCVDTGNPSQSVIPLDTYDVDQDGVTDGTGNAERTPDLDLHLRIIDQADMGAYELHPCYADVNSDGMVNFDDILVIIFTWGCSGSSCVGDIAPGSCGAGDGVVNFDDILAVIFAWGAQCTPGVGGIAGAIPTSAQDCWQSICSGLEDPEYGECVQECIRKLCNAGIITSGCPEE